MLKEFPSHSRKYSLTSANIALHTSHTPPFNSFLSYTFGYFTICSVELFCPFVLFNFGGLAGLAGCCHNLLAGDHGVHQLTVPLLLLPCIQITTTGTVTIYYLCIIWYIVPYYGITTAAGHSS